MPPNCGADTASCMAILCSSPILLPVSSIVAIKAVTTPRPPICIRIRITVLPNSDHCVAVSYTTRPVTQAADVDVNSAFRKGTL